MRLINTTTLELHEFFDSKAPLYAILSHRWGDGEVSFQDLRDGRAPGMEGYAKITSCCRQALKDGFDYAWVDCCCIDKTSSSELSEAINSMFRWYQNAQVCYVYLSDVYEGENNVSVKARKGTFSSSQWFKRGWTLQELLAPEIVIFFNCFWVELGTKETLAQTISDITRIDFDVYESGDASVAQKMSWAARRKTTRVEDKAYCLMGLFGVNMPLLYGEGEDAFLRLQVSILGRTVDDSIFAWDCNGRGSGRPGLLATSPDLFRSSGDIVTVPQRYFRENFVTIANQIPGQYPLTSMGLELQADLKKANKMLFKTYILPLACKRVGYSKALDSIIGIELRQDILTPYIFTRVKVPARTYEKNELRDIVPTSLAEAEYTISGRFWVTQQVPPKQSNTHPIKWLIEDDALVHKGYVCRDKGEDTDLDNFICRRHTFSYFLDDVAQFNLELSYARKGLKARIVIGHGENESINIRVSLKRIAVKGLPYYKVKLWLKDA